MNNNNNEYQALLDEVQPDTVDDLFGDLKMRDRKLPQPLLRSARSGNPNGVPRRSEFDGVLAQMGGMDMSHESMSDGVDHRPSRTARSQPAGPSVRNHFAIMKSAKAFASRPPRVAKSYKKASNPTGSKYALRNRFRDPEMTLQDFASAVYRSANEFLLQTRPWATRPDSSIALIADKAKKNKDHGWHHTAQEIAWINQIFESGREDWDLLWLPNQFFDDTLPVFESLKAVMDKLSEPRGCFATFGATAHAVSNIVESLESLREKRLEIWTRSKEQYETRQLEEEVEKAFQEEPTESQKPRDKLQATVEDDDEEME